MPAKKTHADRIYTMLEKAIEAGADAKAIEAITTMHQVERDRDERKEFEKAFARMQQEIPPIKAERYNGYTRSKYAMLEDIHAVVKPILKKHGFTVRYESPREQTIGTVFSTCIVTHIESGLRAENTSQIPVDSIDADGNVQKGEAHGAGSATTYGKRYSLCGVLDITITQDDDGNKAAFEPRITAQQEELILKLLNQVPKTMKDEFYAEYEEVEFMPLSHFKSRLAQLKEAINKGEK